MVEYAVDWEVGSDVGVGRVVSVKVLRDDRRVWSRWDVLPFVPLWVAVLGWTTVDSSLALAEDSPLNDVLPYLLVVAVAFLHALVHLSTHWSPRMCAWICYRGASSLSDCTHALVTSVSRHGAHTRGIVPVQCGEAADPFFVFLCCKYVYSKATGSFVMTSKPVRGSVSDFMLQFTGVASLHRGQCAPLQGLTVEEAQARLAWYGRNELKWPHVRFMDLFKEQLVAPFFLFQIVSIALQIVDEYVMLSVVSLIMIFFLEAFVASGRLKNVCRLGGVRVAEGSCLVLRGKDWIRVPSSDLVPGDVCSLPQGRVSPADMLVLSGTCASNEAMLTGESTPAPKEGILHREPTDVLDVDKEDRVHVLFGGTSLVQFSPSPEEGKLKKMISARDGGCVCLVLRTGFDSAQGELMRTMYFGSQRVSVSDKEASVFILLLLAVACFAAWPVLQQGLEKEEGKSAGLTLYLHIVRILTSVVPPELPIVLSLAVNTSILVLLRQGIFCTEPFRIPLAGALNACCFDKTGTLTTDEMEMAGIVPADGSIDILSQGVPEEAVWVLAGCHSLLIADGELVGDPMEKAALQKLQWRLHGEVCLRKESGPSESKFLGGKASIIQIQSRFAFQAKLQRMSCVSTISNPQDPSFRTRALTLMKGAPEMVRHSLLEVPEWYDQVVTRLAASGGRVLALAFGSVAGKSSDPKEVRSLLSGGSSSSSGGGTGSPDGQPLGREDVEKGLSLAGFAVFQCPMKDDTAEVLEQLQDSGLRAVVITGDNPLTALHVARQLSITEHNRALILTVVGHEGEEGVSAWTDEAGCIVEKHTSQTDVLGLSQNADLCVTGSGLSRLTTEDPSFLQKFCDLPCIFARVSPDQKESILVALKRKGKGTLMCGDGSNDVGALKSADIGIALLSSPGASEELAKETSKALSKIQSLRKQAAGAPTVPKSRGGKAGASSAAPSAGSSSGANNLQSPPLREGTLVQRLKAALQASNQEEETMPKLGDASMAAPFSTRTHSLKTVLEVVKQGRKALSTRLQMYKVLGTNAVMMAFSMSVLFLRGVKLGDGQLTVAELLMTGMMMSVSFSKPVETLGREHPARSIFSLSSFLSLVLQVSLHLYILNYLVAMASLAQYGAVEHLVPLHASFEPGLVNSVVYLFGVTRYVATFLGNYQGEPFMQPIFRNRALIISLCICISMVILLTTGILPGLNHALDIVVGETWEFRFHLLGVFALDIAIVFVLDRGFRWLLGSRARPRVNKSGSGA